MNAQTEILENRVAQITVEVEAATLEKAKREAARRLSRRANIPGFRKGKAPYSIIARYLGEGAILEEAVDELGPELYRQSLTESGLEPYAPGQLDNIDTNEDSNLVMVFKVPLTPVVEIGEYRAVRAEYTPPVVEDSGVDDVITMLRNNKATTAPKDGPAAQGDQVKIDIYGELAEAPENDADDETAAEPLFDRTGWIFALGETVREPLPGFSAQLEGISSGETRSFELTFPADDEDYEETVRGKTVNFKVTCHEVQTRDLPELDDNFARELGDPGVETLEQLRASINDDLHKNAVNRAEREYADLVLDTIVEGATIEFPEIMIEEMIDTMIEDFGHQLARQGMDLDTYLKYSQIEIDELRADYREGARARLIRSLVLGEIVRAEELTLDSRQVARAIHDRAHQISNGNEEVFKMFAQYLMNSEEGRRDLANELLSKQAFDRIIAIGKGENPPVGPVPFVDEEEVAAEALEEAIAAASAEDTPEADEPAAETDVTEEPADEA